MRSFQLILLPAIFIFGVLALITTQVQADPADEARSFLHLIGKADFDKALAEFGDNTCHCAPKGGYASYLRYEEEPSLAFLFGKKFSIGTPIVKQLPYNGQPYTLPWDKPEDVAVRIPVEIEAGSRPYFLPLETAFGYEISQSQLTEFCQHPDKDWWKAFTLRLRSSVQPNFIATVDQTTIASEADKAAKEHLLPAAMLKYLHPANAGAITMPDKSVVPATRVVQQLPTLKSITIGLKIVRAGMLKRWAVKKIGYEDPVLLLGDGRQATLKFPR